MIHSPKDFFQLTYEDEGLKKPRVSSPFSLNNAVKSKTKGRKIKLQMEFITI